MPRGRCLGRLEPNTRVPQLAPRELLTQCLGQPIASPPLRALAAGKRTAAILIPGKARSAGTRDYIPALVDELNAAGIADANIEVFLADGTHEQHLARDVADLLGEQTAVRIR